MDSQGSSTLIISYQSKDIELSSLETRRHQLERPPSHGDTSLFANPEPSSSSANVQVLPPVDEGWQAWMFCFAALVLEFSVWGFTFSYGIFQEYYTSHPPFNQASRVSVAAVGPTAIAVQYIEGLLLSFFYGRYPDMVKKSMWFGLALCVLSLTLCSFVNQVWLLILLQGVGLGIAGGLLYWPIISFVSEWFVQRRGLAGGIIYAGSGIGGFVFPFLVNALLVRFGHRWTLRIIALLQCILGGVALLGVRPRISPTKYQRGQRRPQLIPPRIQFLKRKVFWANSATNFLQAMSYFPVSLYIAVFTASISSPLSATIVLSLFNSAGVIGQIIIGYLSDRFPYPWIMFTISMGSAIAAFLLWGFADTLARVFAFAIIFGSLSGGFPSVAFAAATDSATPNTEQAPMALSAFSCVKGVAAIIGPIISGILLEAGKTITHGPYGKFGFGPVEIFVGSCSLACSLSSLAVAATRPQVSR
ncbi:unnamed protein product [Somion occarium]|uniref:Major facilitator superfamily (MFS) profile domain-containing protein n=1 Tax=Somion occarium TaxID=3059160 RepID=A0ABP1E567_9APHY